MLTEPAREEFRRLLGPENLSEGDARAKHAIRGVVPGIVVRPATIDEAVECSAICHRRGLSVVPLGGGTRAGFGRAPERIDVLLSTARMDAVIDFQPADMTVTVLGGLTLARLQEVLSAEGQRLPIDPPRPDLATVGGIIAARDTGILRQMHGSPRDLAIGLRVVDPEGNLVRAGSKVVKNVAGYDLPKLYSGSWGTLGLIAEATFRVIPIPEESRAFVVPVSGPEAAEAVVAAALESDLSPVFLEIANDIARADLLPEESPGWKVILGIEGAREDVAWQEARLDEIVGAKSAKMDPAAADAFQRKAADYPLSPTARFVARIALPSSAVAGMNADLDRLATESSARIGVLAHAGVGLITARATREAKNPAADLALFDAIRATALEQGGRVTMEMSAPDLDGRIEPWPDLGDGLGLMRLIKGKLDPKGLWNTGRYGV